MSGSRLHADVICATLAGPHAMELRSRWLLSCSTSLAPGPFYHPLLTLLLIDHLKPFKISTFKNAQLVLYTRGDTIWTVLVASCTTIKMVLEGPLIHHLEVSKQGFVLAVLPFEKIQTGFCISWPTIQNHLGNQHCTQLFHHSKPQ